MHPGSHYHVIARRAKPDVAISWYTAENRTMAQEISAFPIPSPGERVAPEGGRERNSGGNPEVYTHDQTYS